MGDQLLRFFKQLATGTGPEPINATTDLLDELIGSPRLDGEQTEDRVRRRRESPKIS
jgi:hypothetical protein